MRLNLGLTQRVVYLKSGEWSVSYQHDVRPARQRDSERTERWSPLQSELHLSTYLSHTVPSRQTRQSQTRKLILVISLSTDFSLCQSDSVATQWSE